MKKNCRGVVLEKTKNGAIILTADGQFKSIKPVGNFDIGDEVSGLEVLEAKFNWRRLTFSFAAAASLLLAILIPNFLGYFEADTPVKVAQSEVDQKEVVASIKVEINPSLELGLNEDSVIIEAKPLNADGEKVLAKGQLSGLRVTEAMEKITEWSYDLGFLGETKENVVELTYFFNEKAMDMPKEKLKSDLNTQVKSVMERKGLDCEVQSKETDKTSTLGKEAPSSSEKPNNSKTAKDTATADEPKAVEKPKKGIKPAKSKDLIEDEEPINSEKPAKNEDKEMKEKPAVNEQPIKPEKPVKDEDPKNKDELIKTDETKKGEDSKENRAPDHKESKKDEKSDGVKGGSTSSKSSSGNGNSKK